MFRLIGSLLLLWASVAWGDDADSAAVESIHNYHRISEQLLTAGQVKPAHIAALKESGVEMVINLAPASAERNRDEGFLLAEQGISYVQIPVAWSNPTDTDLALFFALMDARRDRKVLVHCFANYRASAFTYLYRVLREKVPEAEARMGLSAVWTEESFAEAKVWRTFVDRHLAKINVDEAIQ